MANTKSTQHEIDLTGSLNLNKFKADIKPYEGFNERNAPYYGGCLSPLYIKDDGDIGATTQFFNGHKYETKNGQLYIDDEQVISFSSRGYKKEYLSTDPAFVNKNIVNFYDKTHYISGKKLVFGDTETDLYGTYVDSRFYYYNNKINVAVIMKLPRQSKYRCYFNSFSDDTITNIEVSSQHVFIEYFGVKDKYIQINETIYNKEGGYFVGFGFYGTAAGSRHYYFVYSDGNSVSLYDESHGQLSLDYNTKNVLYRLAGSVDWTLPICILENSRGICLHYYPNPSVYLESINFLTNQEVTTPNNFKILNTDYYNRQWPDLSLGSDKNNYKFEIYIGKYCPFISVSAYDSTNPTKRFVGYAYNNETLYSYQQCKIGDSYSVSEINEQQLIFGVGGLMNKHLLLDNTDNPLAIFYNDTLLTSWGSVGNKNVNYGPTNTTVFYDEDRKDWCTISLIDYNTFKIIDDYIVINTVDYYNCYNIKTQSSNHWGSCWNNNVSVGTGVTLARPMDAFPLASSNYESCTVSCGQNINWLKNVPCSAKFAPKIAYRPKNTSFIPYGFQATYENQVEIYVDNKYVNSYYLNTYNYNYDSSIEEGLVGSIYPGDAVRYNLPILFDTIQGPLDTTIVNFGSDVSFFTIYYDNKNRYQYYSSSITEFEQFFIIQGQTYGISRNKIYSIIYNSGSIQSSQPVVSIEGLRFIGNTIYNAYFYSKTTRAIYSFGADNNLQLFTQADTITDVTGATYIVGTGSIIIGTPECVYVLNERLGIYRLNNVINMRYAAQLDGRVILVTDNHLGFEISYEKQPLEIDGDLTGWERKDIVIDTAFYGAGSNVVSVNDCWYVRITDPEHKAGEIKLAVSTLTDIGRSTETRTFKVKESDWDELTDTIYIRFQPKLQRAVGVALHIESPFKIGYIGVGATPETLQLNKGTI